MEDDVSVDDFPSPGNLDEPAATGNAVELQPVPGGIRLWWLALDRPELEVAELARSLASEETARAQRFGTELLRQRWIVGRATLRMLLGDILGVAPSAVALGHGRRGRPVLREASLDFNVSHTCGMALIGIAHRPQRGMRIGVDVEHSLRKVNADGLSRKFLSDRERERLSPLAVDARRQGFLRLWTCKEAMSKATGDALSAPFRLLDVSLDGGLALVDGPAPYRPADWTLHPAVVPAGFIATVAIWQPIPGQDARIS